MTTRSQPIRKPVFQTRRRFLPSAKLAGIVLHVLGLLLHANWLSCVLAFPYAFPATQSLAADSQLYPEMRYIPGGAYEPLYKSGVEADTLHVEPFWIDARPVTNGEFLAFVEENPQWRRSRIKPIFADDTYLRHWAGDLDLGPKAAAIADKPVVNVSWFAARAYARWKDKRLPTVAEWERVGLASATRADGREEDGYYQRILAWYSRPTKPPESWDVDAFENHYGVYAMHGLVWEWVEDFNTALVTGESRGDAQLERNLFCGSGAVGSSDFRDYAAFMRFGFRSSLEADYAVPNLGFRCAKNADTKP